MSHKNYTLVRQAFTPEIVLILTAVSLPVLFAHVEALLTHPHHFDSLPLCRSEAQEPPFPRRLLQLPQPTKPLPSPVPIYSKNVCQII